MAIGDDYKRFTNALPQVVWTCDAAGELEWVNDRWLELTGLTREESLVEKGALVAVHPDDREVIQERFAQAVATGSPCEMEYRIRNRQGAYRFHLARVAPLRDEHGAITSWVAVAFDMQDRRDAEQRFETAFNLNPQPTAITRLSDGVYLNVNDAFLKMTGYSREEIVGKTTIELGIWTPAQREAFVASIRAAGGLEVEVPYRTRNGQTLTLALRAERLDLGGVPCLINGATDVTKRRAIEEGLRAADRRKDEFLAMLSHELRNPLAPILTSAQLMQLRGDATSPEELEVIVRQSRHLKRLVDDLLDVSRVVSGKITLEKAPVEIGRVVAQAVAEIAPLVEERKHELVVAVPSEGLVVEGDELRLTQVVTNLLTNAARYTPEGGRVEVSAARENGAVELRVRDSGIGIDPALLPHVFDTFVQGARGPDRAGGGLGLGLALVRTLTTLHGGRVTAHSDGPGRGSLFTVELPASRLRPREVASAPAARPTIGANSRRILIVDDNEDAAAIVASVLRRIGHETRVANGPSRALTIAEEFRPQIALLDIGLPTMDGYALGSELRTRLGASAPLLVALTGYGRAEDKLRSKEAAFALHLVKPIELDDLLRHISDLVAQTTA